MALRALTRLAGVGLCDTDPWKGDLSVAAALIFWVWPGVATGLEGSNAILKSGCRRRSFQVGVQFTGFLHSTLSVAFPLKKEPLHPVLLATIGC